MRITSLGMGGVLAVLASFATAQTGPSLPPWAPPSAVPAADVAQLLEFLSSADPGTRASGAWQLAQIKEPQREVVATLEAHRTDPDRSVRYAVAWALGHYPGSGKQKGAQHEKPAQPKRITRPIYPDAAYRAKVEGMVVLTILIGEDGEVAYAEVAQSIPALDGAALACVRQWRFDPMRVGGRPQPTVSHAPVVFRIY